MASGFFAILDDLAVLLDDTATMSKVAAKKTAAILGDDLAVNAEKATGFHASRELPVIWAITKGAVINKVILLPLAFLLSAFAPWLIVPILIVGGTYLCFEGAEKALEWVLPHQHAPVAARESSEPKVILSMEASKIKSAIRTDFILSIEIVVITLGTVIEETFMVQVLVVSAIALLATVGVYGVVALLVRMDDFGFRLITRSKDQTGFSRSALKAIGSALVSSLPYIIRVLGVVGTIAMLLVGGGIYVHNIESIHHVVEKLPSLLGDLTIGLVVGLITVGCMTLYHRFQSKRA